MKQLTKKQRNEVYKKALKVSIKAKHKWEAGEFIKRTTKINISMRSKYLPELHLADCLPNEKMFTKHFEFMHHQQIILMFCIEMTK